MVEAASALVVDDVGDVVGVGGSDAGEVGAVVEPPAPLAVEVLDLASLPGRVRVTEPDVDPVELGDDRPVRLLRSLVKGERASQMRGDPLETFDEPADHGLGALALGNGDRDRVPGDPFAEPQHRGPVPFADDLVGFPMAQLGSVIDRCWAQTDVGQRWAAVGVTGLAGPAAGSSTAQAVGGLHGQHGGVDRRVDRLHTDPLSVLSDQVSPDRHRGTPQGQLGVHPVLERAGLGEAARSGPDPRFSARLAATAGRYRWRPPLAVTSLAIVTGWRLTPRAITAHGTLRFSINAPAISSRSGSDSGAPGILGPPSVGAGQQHRSS